MKILSLLLVSNSVKLLKPPKVCEHRYMVENQIGSMTSCFQLCVEYTCEINCVRINQPWTKLFNLMGFNIHTFNTGLRHSDLGYNRHSSGHHQHNCGGQLHQHLRLL